MPLHCKGIALLPLTRENPNPAGHSGHAPTWKEILFPSLESFKAQPGNPHEKVHCFSLAKSLCVLWPKHTEPGYMLPCPLESACRLQDIATGSCLHQLWAQVSTATSAIDCSLQGTAFQIPRFENPRIPIILDNAEIYNINHIPEQLLKNRKYICIYICT